MQVYAYPLLGTYFFAVRAIGACALQQVDTVWLIFVHVCTTISLRFTYINSHLFLQILKITPVKWSTM